MAGGLGGYGGGYSLGHGGGFGFGGGLDAGGVGVGSSVTLLRGGPGFSSAVVGPVFVIRTIHHVDKMHRGGAIVAHSGLGGYGSGLVLAGGLGYGGELGYGSSLKYGGYGLKG
ncbi:hypothetical protein V5799_023014 [Amblyomma americanum]|uniref:Uncharacterized protein n=1 Tax=Amblyomma americanum TaxID=6943 RepID=A0AAQ4FKV7_AMBAM